jgi:hypothetical protein
MNDFFHQINNVEIFVLTSEKWMMLGCYLKGQSSVRVIYVKHKHFFYRMI